MDHSKASQENKVANTHLDQVAKNG